MAYDAKSRKAGLVDLLLDNPSAVQIALRRRANPPIILDGEPNEPSPSPPPAGPQPPALDAAAITREVVDAVMSQVHSALAPIQAIIASIPPPGERQPSPLPLANELPAHWVTVPHPLNPRLSLAFVRPELFDAVVNNRMDIKDFWQLDPQRQGEIALGASNSLLRSLQDEFESSEDTKRARAASKYRDVLDLLRPWLVYSAIRELITPGIGVYLDAYARDLLRIAAQFPGHFPALLDYHFTVVQARMNSDGSLDPNEWCRTDLDVFNATITASGFPGRALPAAQQPYRLAAGPPPAPARPWSIASAGTGQRGAPCHRWDSAKPCTVDPCPYVHSCMNCLKPGHTQMKCSAVMPRQAA